MTWSPDCGGAVWSSGGGVLVGPVVGAALGEGDAVDVAVGTGVDDGRCFRPASSRSGPQPG